MNQTEKFIIKANLKHKNKYDYSKTIYIKTINKIIIICLLHGEFEQRASHHIGGCGCPKCGILSRISKQNKTLAKFVIDSNKVHENKYDYNDTLYLNVKTNVIIKCLKHGNFIQNSHNHLQGAGCPKCGIESCSIKKLKILEQFIKEAKNIHIDNYKYDNVQYIGAHNKIIIKCLKHGEFKQTPNAHLQGAGCPKCAIESCSINNIKTLEQFIKEANNIYNNIYKYDNVQYTGAHNKIIIKCLKHGEFKQTPTTHLHGKIGCPKCVAVNIGDRLRKTTEQFIKEAKNIHVDNYINTMS